MPFIRVGENIKNYYKRVAENNLNIVICNNKRIKPIRNIIKKKLFKLVDDFCFDYSYLILVPINNDIMAYNSQVDISKQQNLKQYINKITCKTGVNINEINSLDEAYNLICYIMPKMVGVNDETYMGDLCSNKELTNTNEFLKIKIPSFYKISQFYFKQKHFIFIRKKFKIKLNPYMKEK
jgi:hypothetical protein